MMGATTTLGEYVCTSLCIDSSLAAIEANLSGTPTVSCVFEPTGMPLGRTQETLNSISEGEVVLGGHYALEVTVRPI